MERLQFRSSESCLRLSGKRARALLFGNLGPNQPPTAMGKSTVRLDPHSPIALTLQSSTILTFPQSTRTLALALTTTLTRLRYIAIKDERYEQENDFGTIGRGGFIVMWWQLHR